jgi:hypothetical protein
VKYQNLPFGKTLQYGLDNARIDPKDVTLYG